MAATDNGWKCSRHRIKARAQLVDLLATDGIGRSDVEVEDLNLRMGNVLFPPEQEGGANRLPFPRSEFNRMEHGTSEEGRGLPPRVLPASIPFQADIAGRDTQDHEHSDGGKTDEPGFRGEADEGAHDERSLDGDLVEFVTGSHCGEGSGR